MTSRTEFHAAAQVPDMERRVASMIRLGEVVELDEGRARVRVRAGKVTTGWVPWATMRAGPDRTWNAPEVGEQVIMAAPSGDLAQAVVVGSIYRKAHPAPGSSKHVSNRAWADGATESYDRQGHKYDLNVPSGGSVTIVVGGTTWVLSDTGATLTTPMTTVNGPLRIKGSLHVTGTITSDSDVVGGGVSLIGHKHGGVEPGGGETDVPTGGGGGSSEPPKPVPGSANGKNFTAVTEEDGSRTLTFEDGSTARTDAYGNLIQSSNTLSGPLYYVQARHPVTTADGLTTWAPVGPPVYTNAAGQPLASVTYQPNSITQGANGQLTLDPPVTITQAVPTGDPLPSNPNKFA